MQKEETKPKFLVRLFRGTESSGWAHAAKGAVVLGFLLISATLLIASGMRESPITKLAESVEIINKTLPSEIDDFTNLNTIRVDDKKFTYAYTITRYTAADLDPTVFEESMTSILKPILCSEDETLAAILDGAIISHQYFGKNNTLIATIDVTKEVCQSE